LLALNPPHIIQRPHSRIPLDPRKAHALAGLTEGHLDIAQSRRLFSFAMALSLSQTERVPVLGEKGVWNNPYSGRFVEHTCSFPVFSYA